MARITEQPKSKRTISLKTALLSTVIIAVVAFVAGARIQDNGLFGESSNKAVNTSQLDEVYATLKQKYAGDFPSDQALSEGAARGLVSATNDPYTVFLSPEEAKQFADSLSGSFSGVGAELGMRNNVLTVISVLDNSPAKKAGLLQGDVIAEVNDQDTASWQVDKAVAEIRGEKGTVVRLKLIRDNETIDMSITRDDITDPSVKSSIEDNVGILRISRFSDTDTAVLARAAAADFKSKNVKAVILDLRGNGGGYVTAAQDVASLWLGKDKTIVSERKGEKVIQDLKTSGEATLEGIPTIVLTDGGSASASEIVAGALHDHKVAQLVGQKTFGKGSVQEVTELSGGAELKVTVALWYTPNGKNINKEGITPDVTVDITKEEVNAGQDPQMAKALEMLSAAQQ